MEDTTTPTVVEPVPTAMNAKIEVTCHNTGTAQQMDGICKLLIDQLNSFKASTHYEYVCEIAMPYGHGKLTVTK